MSRWDSEDTIQRIESVIREAITPSMLLVVPAFVGALVLSEEIPRLVFGPEFAIASAVLVILMPEKIVQSVHTLLGRSLQGIDRPDLAAVAGVASMSLNLMLNVVLVIEFGIVGAAVATAVSFTVNSLLHANYFSRFVTIEFPAGSVLGLFGASAAMGVVIWTVGQFIRITTVAELVVVIVFGVMVYGVFIFTIQSIRAMLLDGTRRVFSDQLSNQNR